MTSVAFRLDSSLKIGSGHFTRCYSIAAELAKRGIDSHFIMKNWMNWQVPRLRSIGAKLHSIGFTSPRNGISKTTGFVSKLSNLNEKLIDAQLTNLLLNEVKPDALFVDHYGVDQSWAENITFDCLKIQITDFDKSDLNFPFSILPGPSPYGSFSAKKFGGSTFLAGSLMAPLDCEYQTWYGTDNIKEKEQNILIYFGSGDYWQHLIPILEKLKEFAEPKSLTVISSNAKAHVARLRSSSGTIIRGLDITANLPSLIRGHNSFLGAAGVSLLERWSQGAVSALVHVAPNQKDSYDHALKLGLDFGLGELGSLETKTLIDAVEASRVASSNPLSRLVARSYSDGYGTQRILYLCNLVSSPNISARFASDLDISTLYRIASEEQTRRMSLHEEEISPASHYEWFKTRMTSLDRTFVCELDGCPMGYVRFERLESSSVSSISFAIDRVFRGMGLARPMLEAALNLREKDGELVAYVKPGNIASMRALLSVGFVVVKYDLTLADSGVIVNKLML